LCEPGSAAVRSVCIDGQKSGEGFEGWKTVAEVV